jgi:integrase
MADTEPAAPRPRLTTKLVAATPAPASGALMLWDCDLRGFGVRISASGARTFFLNYRVKGRGGREGRITIGRYPQWICEDVRLPKGLSPEAIAERAEQSHNAREVAQALRRRIDNGEDPALKRRERAAKATMADLAQRYIDTHMPHKTGLSERWRYNYELKLVREIEATLGKATWVEDINDSDIEHMHKRITASGRPVRANRTLSIASKMFALATRSLPGENAPWRDLNPCKGVPRNPEIGKERFYSEQELAAISDALTVVGGVGADCVKLIMLTGCRPNEAIKSQWVEFDQEPGFWIRPSAHVKTRRTLKLPLAPPAIALIERLRAAREPNEPTVFPPRWGGRVNLRFVWAAVRERASVALWAGGGGPVAELIGELYAGLARTPTIAECCEEAARRGIELPTALMDGRIYDLRHSYASTAAIAGGYGLVTIGKLLGHSQSSTTQKYVHLADHHLRRAADQIGAAIANAGQGAAREGAGQGADVVAKAAASQVVRLRKKSG